MVVMIRGSYCMAAAVGERVGGFSWAASWFTMSSCMDAAATYTLLSLTGSEVLDYYLFCSIASNGGIACNFFFLEYSLGF